MHKHQHKSPTSDQTVIEETSNSRFNIVDRPTLESLQVSCAGNDDFESTIVVQPCKEHVDCFLRTQVAVDGRVMMPDTHTYTHPYPYPRFIACTDTYFSFMFTGAFSLHACGVTGNLGTYITSMRRVFLVQTVV